MKIKPKFEWYLTIHWIFCLSKLAANYQPQYMLHKLAKSFYIYQHFCCELGKRFQRPWSLVECDKQKKEFMVCTLFWSACEEYGEGLDLVVSMLVNDGLHAVFSTPRITFCWMMLINSGEGDPVIRTLRFWYNQQLQIYSFEYHLN